MAMLSPVLMLITCLTTTLLGVIVLVVHPTLAVITQVRPSGWVMAMGCERHSKRHRYLLLLLLLLLLEVVR